MEQLNIKFLNKIVFGDSLKVLKYLPDDSIDLLCTDPPYGIAFMGKHWDKAVPSVDLWKECLRVLKPGAFGFVMCIPRQDALSRMIVNLEDAGFNTNFTSIYWSYATGFPKAQNISKAVDKKLGNERKVIGKRKHPTLKDTSKLEEQANASHGSNVWAREWDITEPACELSKRLEGSYAGFQPKPAVEIILVVMKPLSEKTYVDQVTVNGKGVTWFDDCRIPFPDGDKAFENGVKRAESPRADIRNGNFHVQEDGSWSDKSLIVSSNMSKKGRFPANFLVSDDVLNDGQIRKSGIGAVKRAAGKGYQANAYSKESRAIGTPNVEYGDSGSYSRFFDIDAWFGVKFKEFPESVQKTFPFLIIPKAPKSERNIGKLNSHPTVKPLKLMSYLVTLGSRESDVVLDPFVGSGTTGMAAKILKRNYIGIDNDKESCEIAVKRIKAVGP